MLTEGDLYRTLEDDRHLGWGYACLDVLSISRRARTDAAIVKVANQLELDYEDLFLWSNSKHGRWLADMIHGCDSAVVRSVKQQLSAEVIKDLKSEEFGFLGGVLPPLPYPS
jgi:hypothetical protein